MGDPTLFIQQLPIQLFFKVIFLLVIGIFFIFTLILNTNVRSLNRILIVKSLRANQIIKLTALLYMLVTLSLFFLALAIL